MSYCKATWQHKSDYPNNDQPCPAQFNNTFREKNRYSKGLFRKYPGQQAYKHGPKKVVFYYYEGKHLIKDCVKLPKEKSWDKQKDTDMVRHYKSKL